MDNWLNETSYNYNYFYQYEPMTEDEAEMINIQTESVDDEGEVRQLFHEWFSAFFNLSLKIIEYYFKTYVNYHTYGQLTKVFNETSFNGNWVSFQDLCQLPYVWTTD